MSDRAAFISAIAASPDDDLPKLVFADWLDEHGEGARAEFIRLQIAARNEANQFPPVADAKKLARIRELFLTHYRAWLRPVYDALAEPLPVFELPRSNVFGRFAKRVANVLHPAEQPTTHSLNVSTLGLRYSSRGHPLSLKGVGYNGGFVGGIYFEPDDMQPAAELGDLFAAEPITNLTLMMPARPALWRRIDGPHLRQVHTLATWVHSGGSHPGEFADALCGSAHMTGLRALLLQMDLTTALFESLCRSPLRRQLTSLDVSGVRDLSPLLTDHNHGFDALRKLSVQFVVPPGEADLFGGGVSATLCGQLRRLEVSTPVADVRWLTNGPSWEKLEGLSFQQSGMGTASLGALGRSSLLPALTHLSIIDFNLTDADLFTLARSPLVERLHLLELDGPTLGDDAVRILAGVLDRGLQRLRLRGIAGEKLWMELTARFGHRIELTAGEQLV